MRRGRRIEDLRKDKRAVSPVIGVILMVALTVTLVQSPKVTSGNLNSSKLIREIEIGTTLESEGMKAGDHHVVNDSFLIDQWVRDHHVVNDSFLIDQWMRDPYEVNATVDRTNRVVTDQWKAGDPYEVNATVDGT